MAAAQGVDYVDRAKQYARRALRDRAGAHHGRLIRQAAQRFLNDLKRSRRKTCPFLFDRWYANDAGAFIQKLPHVEGRWPSPTIILHDSQLFFVVQLFGFRQRERVTIPDYGPWRPRRFTSALFAVARKNAKSTLAAGILLYCLCCEPEEGAQLISAATTYDQASIIWKIAKRMVEKTPALRDHFGLSTWAKSLSRDDVGAVFKPVHAKASTQDGLNPSHMALDEIHAHKTPDLLSVLESAAGARGNLLKLFTTTEGYTNPGPWGELRQFARQLLEGVFGTETDHFLAVIYAVDAEDKTLGIKADDDFDERAWRKANPLLEVNPHLLAAIRKDAIEAKQMPSRLAEFRIKRLNRPASTATGFIDLVAWQQCGAPVCLDALRNVPCYGGLDLASTRDIAALRLVWRVNGVILTHGWRWVPADTVHQRTERGTVPYAGWVEQGHLIQTPGNVTDHTAIEAQVVWVHEHLNLRHIGYDRWEATDLVNRLAQQDIELREFVQGPKSYHPAIQAIEKAYISGQFAHGGDPVLEWMASNLVVRRNPNLNMAPDKLKSADKIDDMAALFMATGLMLVDQDDDHDLDDFLRAPITA